MPIKKPGQSKDSVNTSATQGIDTVNDKAADEFIKKAKAAEQEPVVEEKPKRKNKVQMMMRIDPDILDQVDSRAIEEGISRSAWISQAVAKALKR
jgi:predicted HicB family RNase H-like nuclease